MGVATGEEVRPERFSVFQSAMKIFVWLPKFHFANMHVPLFKTKENVERVKCFS